MKKQICIILIFITLFLTISTLKSVSAASNEFTLLRDTLLTYNEEELKENVLRLHVLANSDDIEDQKIKLSLKNELTEKYAEIFSDSASLEESIKIAEENSEDIKIFTDNYLKENGFLYECQIQVTESDFPDREYNGIFFPEGKYQAVKIILGEGSGKNWWCVLYPPLCVYKVRLDTSDDIITDETLTDEIEITLKWKFLEWFNN